MRIAPIFRALAIRRFVLLVLVTCAAASLPALVVPASAAVPSVINYQGRLTDNTPQQGLVSGTLTMDFSIWDALVGGSSLWSETQSVQVTSGLFNALLGQVTPIPPTVFGGGAERYLEIHVSGEALSPRQRIAATPFANVAASADDAAGMGGVPADSWQKRIASACGAGMSINAVAADGTVTCVASGSPGCLSGDCRTSWNNQDANSVNPMPRSCPAGQVPLSTGAFHWTCSTLCGFGTADCDNNANNGCETGTATSVGNCGGCGVACSSNHVPTPSCSNFVCNGACAANFADCNTNKQTDGCEINIATDPNNCSNCGIICSNNNMATRACSGGLCSGSCEAGFGDCNVNKLVDGCESNFATDPNNCGGCTNVCSNLNMATRTCGSGICNGTCNPGFGDCNNNKLGDGCENNLMTSPINCGFCGNVCGNGMTCANGQCGPDVSVSFTGSFTNGAASPAQCTDWQSFATRISAGVTYSLVTIKGSNDPVGVSCSGASANTLCQAIRTGTFTNAVFCDGRAWIVDPNCRELTATGATCSCTAGYTVRPCVGNQNWGGVNTNTCSAPSQTMTVICQ